jgi:uncharacterized caspase-like protein
MRLVAAIACAVTLICLGVLPAHADKRVALVIGNAAYRNAPVLMNPKHDAEDVGRSLQGLGFETIVATDLDRGGMNEALDRFSRTVPDADIAVFYYSGHGMQFAGRNYLLPIDAKLAGADDVNRFRLLPLDDITDILQSARGARVVILDACRNNPVEDELKRRLASTPGANRDAFLSRGLGRIAAGNGLIVAYATQASDVAADGGGRNSPFTAAFLQNVGVPDLDLRQMFFRVQDQVDKLTGGRQRPELSISLVGEFKLKAEITPADKPQTANREPAVGSSTSAGGEAERAWAVTQNNTSIAVLEDFIRQFGATPYGSMARARLDELRKSQVATVTPPAQLGSKPADPSVVDESVRAFQALDASTVYVLGTDERLWREFGTWNNAQQPRIRVDETVRAFQAIDATTVYVLGSNGRLWREFGTWDNARQPRVAVAENVKAFQALDANTLYVLGTDGKLSREFAVGNAQQRRIQVAENASAFQALDANVLYVLGTDGRLWRGFDAGSSQQRGMAVDANVKAFQALDAHTVYVLGTNGRLWREFGTWDNPRQPRVEVDADVTAFHALDATTVYVLGSNGRLWLEHGTMQTRSEVAASVQGFQALDDGTVYVLFADKSLRRQQISLRAEAPRPAQSR